MLENKKGVKMSFDKIFDRLFFCSVSILFMFLLYKIISSSAEVYKINEIKACAQLSSAHEEQIYEELTYAALSMMGR